MIEIIIGIGSFMIGVGVTRMIHWCFVNLKMKRNLQKLVHENNKLQNNVQMMKEENANLKNVRCSLENSSVALKVELDNLKDIINLNGEQGEEIYKNLICIFENYKNIVNVDIQTKSIGLLCDLDTNKDFIYSPEERVVAISKLKLLFSDQHIDISDHDFDDISRLKNKLVELFKIELKVK